MAIKFPAPAAALAVAKALAQAPQKALVTALVPKQEATLQGSLLSARRAQSSPLAKLATPPWT